jgi:hypothetical protein
MLSPAAPVAHPFDLVDTGQVDTGQRALRAVDDCPVIAEPFERTTPWAVHIDSAARVSHV